MALPQLVGCSIIAFVTATVCFDAWGVLTRYATWRYHRLLPDGFMPQPDNESAYVAGTRRYARWVGFVVLPLSIVGVVAALLA